MHRHFFCTAFFCIKTCFFKKEAQSFHAPPLLFFAPPFMLSTGFQGVEEEKKWKTPGSCENFYGIPEGGREEILENSRGLWRFWWNSREWKEKTPGICITTHLNKVKFIFLLLAEMICTLDFFSASLFVKRQKIEASRVTPPVAPKTSEVKVPLSICCIRLYTFFCAFYRLQSVCQ